MTLFKRSLLFIAVIVTGIFLYLACNETVEMPPVEPEITYDLEQVEGTQNADMILNQGEAVGRDSWFEVNLSGIESAGILTNGATEGWCVEWQKNIAQNGDTHNGLTIYSTEGKERWKPLNYLLTIKDRLQREDPDLTFREIQAAIWSVVDGSDFDVDMPAGDMPPRLTRDGQPNFDREKVRAIVNNVMANASSHKYKTGSRHALFITSTEDNQTVTVPSQETVSHGFVEGVTPSDDPRFAERTYPVVQADWDGHGGDKKWLGWNLGATQAPESVTDTSKAAAGWYFQFNRKQGHFFHSEQSTTPSGSSLIPTVVRDWEENDPCKFLLGEDWRLPTIEEWENFRTAPAGQGGMGSGNLTAAFESDLNLHASGNLDFSPQGPVVFYSLNGIGQTAFYHSSSIVGSDGAEVGNSFILHVTLDGSSTDEVFSESTPGLPKNLGASVRCIKD